MLKSVLLAAAVAAFATGTVQPAGATYSCTVSPDGKSVIVKVSNPDPVQKSCTVNCQFKIPGGGASVSCTKTVPAGVTDWQMCVRSTGGDKYTFRSGDEECSKR